MSSSPREALHVGNLPFPDPGNVYFSMINVFMETGMHDIEFCLDNGYHTLIYNGNFDIICDHRCLALAALHTLYCTVLQ